MCVMQCDTDFLCGMCCALAYVFHVLMSVWHVCVSLGVCVLCVRSYGMNELDVYVVCMCACV